MTQAPSATRPAIVGLEALSSKPVTSGSQRPWLVAVVSPCFNRREDLALLLGDLAGQDLRPIGGRPITMWVTVVDNASTQPLSTLSVPAGLEVEFVRSEVNTGGSGGFNMGMRRVLSGEGLSGRYDPPDFVWWLDSDARVTRRSLRELVKVLVKRPKVGVVGSGLRCRETGKIWEVGGQVDAGNGTIYPQDKGGVDHRLLTVCDYVAACSALVRREAIEKTGLWPDNFIYFDDVDWCVQMRRRTGLKVRANVRSRVYHPPADRRFATWARYYNSRNGFSVMRMLGMGPVARFRRAMFEVNRAVAQSIMGLGELSELHLRGLRDAARGEFPRIEPKNLLKPLGFQKYGTLRQVIEEEKQRMGAGATLWIHPLLKSNIAGLEEFRRELKGVNYRWPDERRIWRRRALGGHLLKDGLGALARLVFAQSADIAVVPTGWPSCWFRGRTTIQITSEGFLVRRKNKFAAALAAAVTALKGTWLALRLAVSPPGIRPLEPVPARTATAAPAVQVAAPAAATA